jgi:hypothetical protein
VGIAVALIIWKVTHRRKVLSIEDRVFAITEKFRSPGGVEIWVEENAVCSPVEQAAIENGLLQCFEKARAQGYDRPLSLTDYRVAIIADSVRSPEAQIWSYKLPAGPYTGTEWDLGGYILAAGQMIAAGTPYGNIIAIPDHHGTDLEQLEQIVMYEAEHIILAYCDGDKFEATKIHGQGQGHPLF